MSDKDVMTIRFIEDGDSITVKTDFGKDIPIGEMFALCGRGIAGILETCEHIGHAKGMTAEQIHEAMYGNVEQDQ